MHTWQAAFGRLRGGTATRRAVLLFCALAALPAQAGNILTQHGAAPAPVTASVTASLVAQQQASAVATQSANELSKVATALLAAQAAQDAARNIAAATPSSLPAGLQTGGLVPDSGLASPGVANPVQDWTGASTPTQSTAGGQTTVTINQTAAQAILSWNSFNVSPSTTVQFNQQQASWTALNRIAASGVPSQILGSIKAPGQVYLIDPNGIIFGGASQVNVGALLASSAAISNSQFTGNGIYSTEAGLTYSPSFTNAGGPITVQAGAQITTAAPALTSQGGFVLLMGSTVANAGTITTPDGQAELAAGDNFLLRPGFSTANSTSTTNLNEIAVQLNKKGSSATGGSGAVSNSGVITADTGDITLAGENVAQNGVLLSTTTVLERGTIHLLSSASDPFADVTLGANSLTLVEPDLADPTTAYDSARAGLITASAAANASRALQANADFDDLSALPDQQEDSRIEITAGNTVEFQGGSQTFTPGGQIAVSAVSRIQTDSGALLDVAGTYGVALPVSANDIAVNIQSFETRDNPQNRLTQNLRNNTVYVDARTLSMVAAGAGGDASSRAYTSGGVLEVSGYLNKTGHTIGEWTALGGTITLATGPKGAVVAQSGAVLDIDGGSIAYQAGLVPQSYLLGEDGRVYNVNTAPAYITYAGVYAGSVDNHAAWGVSQTYANTLSDPAAVEEPGYTVGRDAGTLTLDTPTSLFNATIDAGVVNGVAQTASAPAGVSDPYTLAQNVVAEPGALVIAGIGNGYLLPGTTSVVFNQGSEAADSLTVGSRIAASLAGTSSFNAAALTQAGLGGLNVLTQGTISLAAPLSLAPGAAVSLFGSAVTLAAALSDPSGSVSLGNYVTIGGTQEELAKTQGSTSKTGNILLANGAVIDTAGLWTNLALDPAGPNDTAFLNGGAVSLISATNLLLYAGSGIDASAGALIAGNGARTGGAGGAVSLALVNAQGGVETGDLRLDGTLASTGFSAGGALTLDAPNFEIGAVAASANPAIVTLQPGFFDAGFSAYDLNGQFNIAPDTAINVLEPTEQFTDASATVPTGGEVSAGATLALLPLYAANAPFTSLSQRPGASLTLASTTNFTLGAGSSITVDPKQSITVSGVGQITLDGDLTAPGGTINVADNAVAASLIPFTTYANGKILSVWIGSTSQISTAGEAFIAANAQGESLALAPAGGVININANDAVVILQPGAVLDAAGSAATEQPAVSSANAAPGAVGSPGAPVALASAGGTISLASNNGLFLQGSMIAPAGGANAAGGTLALSLNSDDVLNAQNLSDAPRILNITQADTAAALPANLKPGVANAALVRGSGQISAAQIAAGGFGTLDFTALDAFLFQGNVSLAAAQSITFNQGVIADGTATGAVTVSAPYVMLNGNVPAYLNVAGSDISLQSVTGYSPVNSSGAFTVDAALIDVQNAAGFGGIQTVSAGTGTRKTNLRGFANVDLDSSGDLRFLQASLGAAATPPPTTLISTGNITLTASTIYSTYSAAVLAGFTPTPSTLYGSFLPSKTLTIAQAPGTQAAAPEDAGGSIGFYAATIADSGSVWDPLGAIRFGSTVQNNGGAFTGIGDSRAKLELLPGSLTSVSAAGLTIPYGGTTDGVSYQVGGASATISGTPGIGLAGVALKNAGTGNSTGAIGTGSITLDALGINIAQGATLDLSGGGNFTGEGFISGEGGSVNVLTAPLLKLGTSGGVTQPGLGADPVYAIVAGTQPEVAPVQNNTQTGATGSAPAVGEQIIIPAGIPGLPAGRYTLLPASYALNPGGYRVEFDGAASLAAPAVLALPNGSYAVAGQTGVVNTNVVSALAVNFTITPAATVQNYANYDTESYSQFLVADAAQFGALRPVLPEDAGSLFLYFPALSTASLSDAGLTEFAPAPGGDGGTLQISGAPGTNAAPSFAIYGASAPTPAAATVDLSAAAIDAFDPAILEIGTATAGFDANTAGITLDSGATLTAARVILTALNNGITVQSGATIDTVGQGSLLVDSTNAGPYFDGGASVLDIGNGYLTYTNAGGAEDAEYGPITIADGATIHTAGSIAFSTGAAVNIGAAANYGGAYLDLAVPEINIGDPAALGANVAPGLTLTPAVLAQLTAGVPSAGVPAVQILVLSASQSLNFFGTTGLDLGGGTVQLVINSPAIYGYGSAGDVATISAGTIVWNGDLVSNPNFTGSGAPGGVVANGAGTGAGTLDFNANTIVFGYSGLDQPARDVKLSRITLGFATVNLNAATEITSNNQGSLAVYQAQAVYGQAGTGGVLNLNTPLLTGGDASTMAFTAGGALDLIAPPGSAPASLLSANTAGAELDLTARTLNLDSAVILPSGKLSLAATGDITLGAASALNLAGDVSAVLGTATQGAGGTLLAASAAGNITQAAGGLIDVSATGSSAGAVTLTAPGGTAALDGTLKGSAPAGATSGSFTASAQNITDFAGLNAALNSGGFFDSRSFELGAGDLTVGSGVDAQNIAIALDAGSLTVTGTLDASFGSAGSIALAAANDLTLAASAVLDAQGMVLQTDSYGQAVAAANTPQVSLTTASGELTLDSGAAINLASADGVARGDLELNVPRLGGAAAGDADISAAAGLNISGAASIAVNAFQTYHGLADPTGTASGAPDALITQAYLDQINSSDTLPFMAAAASNADLASRVAGLRGAYGAIYHFRPGVQITSATANGDLTVQGDLDLAGFRYGAGVNPAVYGSGEPGVLRIRAGGNLNIYGSITDGFAPPISDAGTSYAKGWVLYAGQEPYSHNIVVPTTVTLAAGTSLGTEETVNYAVPTDGGTFASGAVAPVALTLAGAQVTSVAFVATSNITSSHGAVLFAAGTVVPAGTRLPNGAIIAPGGSLPFALNVGPVTWPANTPFTLTSNDNANPAGAVVLAKNLTLAPGSVIPGDSYIDLLNGAASVSTRAALGGTQGQLIPLGALLPAGDESWSIQLVSGAQTQAADPGAVQSASALAAAGDAGNLTLADTHYGLGAQNLPVPAFSVVRTGTGALSLVAGGSITEASDYGVYTAGAQAPGIASADNLPQGRNAPGNTLLGNPQAALGKLAADYQANYPQGGGNVLLSAQGALNGFISTTFSPNGSNALALTDTDALGSWLWLQGGAGQPGAWWVEFGALEPTGINSFGNPVTPQLDGFQGIGTLGGGNLTVTTGGSASGLNLAVASTGRVQADGTLAQTGGGNLNVTIGEGLNFTTSQNGSADAGGLITDLRGNTTVNAGSIGTIVPSYSAGNAPADDPRVVPALQTELAQANAGIDLAPGDGAVTVNTRGDLVIDDVADPGVQANQVNSTPVNFTSGSKTYKTLGGGTTIFTLWPADTSVSLNAAGGDITPAISPVGGGQNDSAANLYPPSLSVVAQNGNIDFQGGNVELAPAADGTLDLLAAGSIYGTAAGSGAAISISGADPSLEATPFNPLIDVVNAVTESQIYTNSNINEGFATIAYGPDTPAENLHTDGQAPALVLAGTDIIGLTLGQAAQLGSVDGNASYGYQAALPFSVAAGRDIIASGSITSPSVFLNLGAGDVTSITAGRDILESSFDIAGPGTLVVTAGRDVYQAGQGVINSIGPLFDINPQNRDGGAGVSVLAGIGAAGPDYAAFENLYLNPDSTLGLTDASAILAENDAALLTYLQTNFGYTGTAAGAYARFQSLTPAQQQVFLRDLYFAMLNQSGLEFNTAGSVRYKSYALGRGAIAALFPAQDSAGQPIDYSGAITLFGPSGIHTDFGGAIQTLTPGGDTIVGVEGATPPASAGIITQGSGDIDMFAQQDVLLGESRVLTTYGGNILIWSAQGNINAGKGSKTTIDYTPLQRLYDDYGNVALSPNVPSTGAGIGTLNPIAQIAPGNINLVAPLGTVDAGEAGIRVSGNLNIAAAHVANSGNLQVQGSTSGVPAATAVDVGALTTAGNSAGAAAQSAEVAGKGGAAQALPSIWIVEILGYGDGEPDDEKKKKGK